MIMKISHHPRTEDLEITDILAALGDPVRFAIVKHLYENRCELNCNQAASPFSEVAKSTLSGHFRILREAGIINVKKQGVENLNSLRIADLEKRFPKLLTTILKI